MAFLCRACGDGAGHLAHLLEKIGKRRQENQKYLRLSAKPRRSYELAKKKWSNRKTTKYFRCKNCGQELSVPRGKGTMRVVCPKCKTETKMKS